MWKKQIHQTKQKQLNWLENVLHPDILNAFTRATERSTKLFCDINESLRAQEFTSGYLIYIYIDNWIQSRKDWWLEWVQRKSIWRKVFGLEAYYYTRSSFTSSTIWGKVVLILFWIDRAFLIRQKRELLKNFHTRETYRYIVHPYPRTYFAVDVVVVELSQAHRYSGKSQIKSEEWLWLPQPARLFHLSQWYDGRYLLALALRKQRACQE